MSDDDQIPTVADIRRAQERLRGQVRETPVWEWSSDFVRSVVGGDTSVFLKLELFQVTGTFKARGALAVIASLSPEEKRRGITAASGGSHAVAAAYAAKAVGTSAKVFIPRTASPARVALCESFGAEVVSTQDIREVFSKAQEAEAREGRRFVHPFEGPLTALGTATLGAEMYDQIPDLDYVIVPIGGGGLCAGVSCAIKQLNPKCEVIGVEPVGADTMYRSFQTGKPEAIDAVQTIADSLGAPYAMPYSFGLCHRYVDEIVRVDDSEICRAMYLLFRDAKLAVEPAGAAATAALVGPLAEKVRGKRVGVIVCGANIDPQRFSEYVARGEREFAANLTR